MVFMEKPRYLYHGGAKKLIGEELIPKKANDLGRQPEDNQEAIYASDVRDEAIIAGITSCKGVGRSSYGVKDGKTYGIIYTGWPEQEFFYLYTLSSDKFENIPKGSHQWISSDPVKPVRIEKLSVKENIYLVRKATEEETEAHIQKFGKRIEEPKKKEKLKI